MDSDVEFFKITRSSNYRSSSVTVRSSVRLLQPRVLRLGFFQDGNVGVGIFPEREEIFVRGDRPGAGGIGICSLRSSRSQSIGTSHAQMRQRSGPTVPHNAAVVDNLLKLDGGFFALPGCQICLSANVQVIEAGSIVTERNEPQLERGSSS